MTWQKRRNVAAMYIVTTVIRRIVIVRYGLGICLLCLLAFYIIPSAMEIDWTLIFFSSYGPPVPDPPYVAVTYNDMDLQHGLINNSIRTALTCDLSSVCDGSPAVPVVTAFFNLGTYRKGWETRSSNTYYEWSSVTRLIVNPMFIFTDDAIFYNQQVTLRRRLPTRLELLRRSSLSEVFGLEPEIRSVMSSVFYPKHAPSTTYPAYNCVTHVKFLLLLKSIQIINGSFDSIIWLDIGLFRELNKSEEHFALCPPPNLPPDAIAVNQVELPNFNQTYRSIIAQNNNWIGGGLFMAATKVMKKFAEEYLLTFKCLLRRLHLVGGEQQILYGMKSADAHRCTNYSTPFQPYKNDSWTGDKWFYLGYLMRRLV